jgi:hypothetical protein
MATRYKLIHTGYFQAFTFTLDANSNTDSVTYPVAYGNGVVPVVVCNPPYQTSFWITNVNNTGFTFNVGTTNGYNQTIMCHVCKAVNS